MPKQQLTADVIIIGFVGPLGSGCTFLSDGLAKNIGATAHHFKLSDAIRRIAKEQGIRDPSTSIMQDIGDELRKKRGVSVLAQEWCTTTKEGIEKGTIKWAPDHMIFIDGIRNEGEVRYLRQFANFFLISVFAHQEIRRQRLVGRGNGHRFHSDAAFFKADARDQSEYLSYGQQVSECNYLSDIIIDNNTTFPELSIERDTRNFLTKLHNNYILSIQQSLLPAERVNRGPSMSETLMTAAYGLSKRSTCMKRQVGAIVAYVPDAKNSKEKPRTTSPQFQIISCGYNEVPEGSQPCVFSTEEKCYRESLQQQHAELWKHCPNCGEAIAKKMTCPECKKKVETLSRRCITSTCRSVPIFDYPCTRCGQHVFLHFLTGGKRTPTRMLDMCKALHAEEQALLGVQPAYRTTDKGNLMLFTTTFPCNLCANKIVAAGIKKVVFAEPYPMQEAMKILESGEVETEQFEGIKSRAYFRLFR